MTSVVTRAPLPYRAKSTIQTLVGYGSLIGSHPRSFLGSSRYTPQEQELNALLCGYPSNHTYRVHGKELIPCLNLYERLWKVARTWPAKIESFLDIGCCRGFYTLNVAQRPECRLAVGIDVKDDFITTPKKVSDYLGLTNTAFHLTTLDHVVDDPKTYGGPFGTILFIGTYHYSFWGSAQCDHCFRSHDEILSRLASLATDRVIISGRFEMDRLPNNIRTEAMKSKEAADYNTQSFVDHAQAFFKVEEAGFLGTYPLFILHKK